MSNEALMAPITATIVGSVVLTTAAVVLVAVQPSPNAVSSASTPRAEPVRVDA